MSQKSKRIAKLWKQLDKEGITNKELAFFIASDIPRLKRKAAEKLLQRNPSKEYLIMTIINLSEYRNRNLLEIACKKLLNKPTISNEDLRIILKYSNFQKKKAAEKLFFSSPTNMDLCLIAQYYPEMSRQVWAKMEKRFISTREIKYFIEHCEDEDVRVQAGKWLLKNSKVYGNFKFVAEQIPSLRKEAWDFVLKKNKKISVQPSLFENTTWYRTSRIKREKIFQEILELSGAA